MIGMTGGRLSCLAPPSPRYEQMHDHVKRWTLFAAMCAKFSDIIVRDREARLLFL